MNRLKTLYFSLFVIFISLQACKKDEDSPSNGNGGGGEVPTEIKWQVKIFEELSVQQFSVDVVHDQYNGESNYDIISRTVVSTTSGLEDVVIVMCGTCDPDEFEFRRNGTTVGGEVVVDYIVEDSNGKQYEATVTLLIEPKS